MPRRLEEWHLDDYLQIFWLHKWLILATTLFLGISTGLYMINSPNVYEGTARILIETSAPRVVEFQEVRSISPWDVSFLRTEYEVISSRAVMSRTIEELHLAAFPPFSKAKDPVRALQLIVTVEPVRSTKLVDISAKGTQPELAARIANAIADIYAKINLERRKQLTTGGAQWLREEVTKMETKMRDAQLHLQDFREQYANIDFAEDSQNTILQRVQALNVSLTKTREERIEAEAKFREKHPKMQELSAKEKELQLALFEQEQRALEMSRLSIQYNTLLREARTSEQIYNVLLTRLKELSVQEGLQSNNVQVVDYARVPDKPIGPPRTQRTVLALFLGLFAGCGVSLLREVLSKSVRTRQDFEQILGIPFLGHVPLATEERTGRGVHALLLLKHPKSAVAEALRSVRTTLEFILPAGEPHALLITSALPEEGKSLICANLAIALHELDRKVLLVDADLRRPSLHRSFELPLEPGLSGFLQGNAAEQELIQSTSLVENLHVVTAGSTPPQPVDLLNNPSFRALLETWKKEYQYILIDSPPVLVAADAAVLATVADGVLYLIRANRTHSEAAAAAKQRLVDVGAKMLGGILNGARLEMERGYRYYYSYRYYRGGERRR